MSDSPKEANGSTAETTEPQAAAAPIFGSASTFGAGTGFGGFTGIVNQPKTEEPEDGDDGEGAPEEECKAEFKPIVQLEEVEVKTGEEDEESLFDVKSKLYRFDNDAGEWKERGVGQSKLLRNKATNFIRFLFRQDKTLKIRGNHIVMPGTKVQEHSGSEKAMVWSCVDFADEVQKPELFCLRFGTPERAQEFKKVYDECCDKNAVLLGDAAPAAEKDSAADADKAAADDLAATLASTKVEDTAEEEKKEEKPAAEEEKSAE